MFSICWNILMYVQREAISMIFFIGKGVVLYKFGQNLIIHNKIMEICNSYEHKHYLGKFLRVSRYFSYGKTNVVVKLDDDHWNSLTVYSTDNSSRRWDLFIILLRFKRSFLTEFLLLIQWNYPLTISKCSVEVTIALPFTL